MPLRRIDDLSTFDQVSSGGQSTLRIPASGTLYSLHLKYAESGTLAVLADIKAAISEIRLVVNGETVRRMSATDLIALNQYHGQTFAAGYLDIFFAEPWRIDQASEEAFAWGMADVDTFVIEVDIASGRTAPTLSAYVVKTLAERNLGAIKKIRKYRVSPGATGEYVWQTHPKTEPIEAMHAASGDIDDASVVIDGAEVFDTTAANISNLLNTTTRNTAQANYFHIPFNLTGRAEDMAPVVNSVLNGNGQEIGKRNIQQFDVTFNMSGTGAFDVVSETIGTL